MTANVQSMSCVCGNTIAFLAIDKPTPLICPGCQDTILSSTIPGRELASTCLNSSLPMFGATANPTEWKVGDIVCDSIEIVECLGRGGMGTVFRARNHAWNVDLAVKCPNQRMLALAGGVEHVERECNTWVKLGLHAHVVTCYYVRRIENVPYIFTDYIAGGDLGRWISDGRLYRGTDEEVLARILSVIIQCAWGLQFAHSGSIVHLDIKPSNIVVTEGEIAKLTDFGLASKIRDGASRDDSSSGSSSGGMTPAYCAPEQLAQRPVGFETDIWALGVTLLELFVGRVEWKIGPEARDYLEVYLGRHARDAGARRIPASVVAIIRACLVRDSNARLNSASGLAELLISAYAECLGVSYPLSAPANIPARIENSNNRAVSLWDLGERHDAMALWRETLGVQPGHFESTFNLALEQWRCAQITDEEVLRRIENLPSTSENADDVVEALTDIHVERGDLEQARELNTISADRSDELLEGLIAQSIGTSRLFLGAEHLHFDSVTAVAISPDARFVYSSSRDNSIRCWDIATRTCTHVLAGHRCAVLGVAFSPDGLVCVSHDERGVVRLWRTADATSMGVYSGPWEQVFSVALTPEYRSLVVLADQNIVYTVDLDTQALMTTSQGPGGVVHHGHLSKDGSVAASGLGASTVVVWEPTSGKTVRSVRAIKSELMSLTVSENGRFVAWGDHVGSVRILDLTTTAGAQEFRGHRGAVREICILDDDRHMVTVGSDKSLRLWELSSRRCLATMPAPRGCYQSLTADARGDLVVAGTEHGSVDFWRFSANITFRAAPFRLSKVVDTVSSQVIEEEYELAIERAKTSLTSGDVALAVKAALAARSVAGCDRRSEVMGIWFDLYPRSNLIRVNDAWEIGVVNLAAAKITAMAHLPRSARYVIGDSNGAIHVYDQESGIMEPTSSGHSGSVTQLTVSHEGTSAISRGDDGNVFRWGVRDLERTCELSQHSTHAQAMDLSPDAQYVVTADWRIEVANVFTGDHVATLGACDEQVRSVVWLPDGRTVAVAAGESIHVYDLPNNRRSRSIDLRPYLINTMAVSPDSRYILIAGETMASRRGGLYIWDTKSSSYLIRRENLTQAICGLCFLPDGRHYLLGTSDGAVAVWHVDSEDCVRVLGEYSGTMSFLSASQDGRYVFALNKEGGAKIWALDWELDFTMPADSTARILSISECDRTAQNVLSALGRQWRTQHSAAESGDDLTPSLPSIRRRIENAGLGGVSPQELKRVTRRQRFWRKRR